MDEHDPLIERLRGLGPDRIDPAVAARHLGAMAGIPVKTHRFVKAKVGTAFFAGLMLGGTGLAYADALPASVQSVAHGALSQVGLSVPNGHGPARYNGPECTGGPYANHGQYVRSHKSDPNAGQSRCGKPVQAGNGTDDGTEPPENDQGGSQGRGHGQHANHGKPATTPTMPRTAPTHRGTSGNSTSSTTNSPTTSSSAPATSVD